MKIPKIISAKATSDQTLVIQFSNHEIKQYDITPLLEKHPFQLLSNSAFFRAFQIEPGGHALVWNEDIDLSEYELWRNGTEITGIIDGVEKQQPTLTLTNSQNTGFR